MTTNERLLCPKTNDGCDYAWYCSEEKVALDQGGYSISSPMRRINELLPDEVSGLMSGFCADERVLALNSLVNTSSDENVKKFATIRAKQISTSESFFNNERAD